MKIAITLFALFCLTFSGLSNFQDEILSINFAKKPNIEINTQSKNTISVLTLNTWGLPIWYPNSNKSKRYDDIHSFIEKCSYDIVSLQEVFDRKLINKINTPNNYYIASDYNCSRKSAGFIKMDCYGGLMTLSKYPIIKEQFYQYPIEDDYKLEEKIGGKGFLVSTIITPKCTMNVINTHLYSGCTSKDEKHRLNQIKYMNYILNQNVEYNDNPILLTGDLNTQHPSTLINKEGEVPLVYEYIKNVLNFVDFDQEITDDEYTYDNRYNKYTPSKSKQQKLDYVLAKTTNGIEIEEISHKVVCNKTQALSDHSGYLSIIEIKEKKQQQVESLLAASAN